MRPRPAEIREIAEGLVYRDFITVGLLCEAMQSREEVAAVSWSKTTGSTSRSPMSSLGRLQIFNNWSPAMVADPEKMWIGVEYFCYETDSGSGISPMRR